MGDDFQRIDVEAGVGLIHHAELWVEHRHLEDLTALFFAAGKALVERAGGELAVHLQRIHFFVEFFIEFDGIDLLALRQTRRAGGADEVGDRDAGDFQRILKGEEDARVSDFVRFFAENVFPFEKDLAGLDNVVLVARP